MKKSIKAALLSALIYPGAGHFFLKKYVTCSALMSVFSVPLFLVISETVNKANEIVEQIINAKVPLDTVVINDAISTLIYGTETQELSMKFYLMLIVWVISILDSYRLGRDKTHKTISSN